jgi:hypothetical protein
MPAFVSFPHLMRIPGSSYKIPDQVTKTYWHSTRKAHIIQSNRKGVLSAGIPGD